MDKTPEQEDLQALLEWYALAGVDEAIADYPVDRFALVQEDQQPARTAQSDAGAPAHIPDNTPARTQRPVTSAPAMRASSEETAMAASALAASADTLDSLRDLVAGFDGCSLKETAKSLCFADGLANSRVMFIGEAPERDEDIQGKPLAGRAGQLLDRMLAAIALKREDVYITNIVYWRPPGNRAPTPAESAACRPFLDRQIELVDPSVIVFLGGAAAKHMLKTTQGILRMRGSWQTFKGTQKSYPALATLHPADLLRMPAQKRLAWIDFLNIQKFLMDNG